MKKFRLSKVLISILCALVMALVIIPAVSYAGSSHNANSTQYSVRGSNGITRKFYRIKNRSQTSFTDFCITGGAKLTYSPWVWYSNEISMYDLGNERATQYFKSVDVYHSAMWLADNAVITNNYTTEEMVELMKANLKEQFDGAKAGASAGMQTKLETAKGALDNLNNTQIQIVEACVFWSYSVYNSNSLYNDANLNATGATKTYADALKDAILYVAGLNTEYEHPTKTPSVKTDDNFAIDINNKKAGPFIITGVGTVSEDKFKVTVNGNTSTFNFETIDEASGKYNITGLRNLNAEGAGENKVKLEYKGLKTEAKLLKKGDGYQNLITIKKSIVQAEDTAQSTNDYKVDLALVKTISQYTNYGESPVAVDRFNPQTDVDTTPLDDGKTDALYAVNKLPVVVKKGAKIKYTYYIFNEGRNSAKAKIRDYMPDGLELSDDEDDKKINSIWEKAESEDGYTCYELKDFTSTINEYKNGSIDYAVIEMVCKLNENSNLNAGQVLTNYAEILADDYDNKTKGAEFYDIDSEPGNMELNRYIEDEYVQKTSYIDEENNDDLNKGTYNQQDDDDFERITVAEKPLFDLALRKFISKVNDIEYDREPKLTSIYHDERNEDTFLTLGMNMLMSGKTTFNYEHTKEPVKVNVGDKVTYTIRVYKETIGENTDGYASVITDNYSEWLVFDEDATVKANPDSVWDLSFNEIEGKNEIEIKCKPGENIGKAYISDIMEYGVQTGLTHNEGYRYYQEVKLVFNVKDGAPVYDESKNDIAEEDTRLINIARISKYCVSENGGTLYEVNNDNEQDIYTNKEIIDRDSSVGEAKADWATNTVETTTPNNSDVILSQAREKLNNLAEEYGLYTPGVQDDDDFDTVIVIDLPTEYGFKVIKKGEKGNTINGVKFNLQNTKLNINIPEKTTENGGIINFFEEDAKEYRVPDGQSSAIECFKLEEVIPNASEEPSYIPMKNPVYVYVKFIKAQNEQGNTITKIDSVKVSDNKIENISDETFDGLTSEMIVESVKDGKNCNVVVGVNASNEVEVTVTNPPVEGKFYTVLIKKDARGNNNTTTAIGGNGINGIRFSANGVIYETARVEEEQGAFEYPAQEYGLRKIQPGVEKITFREVASKAPDGEITYIGLKEPIDIYYHVIWKDYEYTVDKVGFANSFDDGTKENIEWVTDAQKYLAKQVKLVDGSNAYAKLLLEKDNNGNGIKAMLYVPNTLANFNVKIQKLDYGTGNTIDIPFTVKDVTDSNNPVTIWDNAQFPTDDSAVITAENVSVSKTYVYTIKEEENNLGYRNIFKEYGIESMNLHITVDNKGIVSYVGYTFNYNPSFTSEGGSGNITNFTNNYIRIKETQVTPPSEDNGYIGFMNTVSVEIKNPIITGNYELKLQKVESSNGNPIQDVTFKVNDKTLSATDASGCTKYTYNNGSSEVSEIAITNANKDVIDEYEITEITVDESAYLKLNEAIKLYVEKGLSNDGKYYVVKDAYFKNSSNSKVYTINVKCNDSSETEVPVEVSYSTQTLANDKSVVTVRVPNIKKVNGKFYLNIMKYNSAIPGKYVEGVTFTAKKQGSTEEKTGTTDSFGFANLVGGEDGEELTSDGTIVYTISEKVDGDYVTSDGIKYTKLKYYDIEVTVHVSSETNGGVFEYYVSSITKEIVAKNDEIDETSQEAIEEKDMLDRGVSIIRTYDTVLVKIPNKPVSDIKIDFKKISTELNDDGTYKFLTNGKFTVKDEEGNKLLDNEPLRKITIENVDVNKEYKFDLYEDEAPGGYMNVLKSAGMHIRLTLYVESSGNIKWAVSAINDDDPATSNEDVNTKRKFVRQFIGEVDDPIINGHSVTVVLKNPPMEGKYNVKLVKKGPDGNNATNQVDFKAIINILNEKNNVTKEFSTNASGQATIIQNAPINSDNYSSVDTYGISEVSVGNNNFVKLTEPITLYVKKGEVEKTYTKDGFNYKLKGYGVTGIGFTDSSFANTASTNVRTATGEVVTVTANVETLKNKNNEDYELVTVTVPNKEIRGKYKINVSKIDSNTEETVSGATFEVKSGDTSLYTYEENNNGVVHVKNGTTASASDEFIINGEGVDTYIISEISAPNGYATLKYNKIRLNVQKVKIKGEKYTVRNATITIVENADVEGKDLIYAEFERIMLEKYADVRVSADGQTVTVTVPNEVVGAFGLHIEKVDADDNTKFLDTAKFTLTGPDELDTSDFPSNSTLENGKYEKLFTGLKGGTLDYTFTLTEDEVPEGYRNVFKDIQIKIKVQTDEYGRLDRTKTEYSLVCTADISEEEKASRVSFAREYIGGFDFETKQKDINNDGVLEDVDYVKMVIKNPKKEGFYMVDVTKVSGDARVSGVTFKINGEDFVTSANGVASYKENNSVELPITSENINDVDEYVISEVKVSNGDKDKYVKLKAGQEIKFYVSKREKADDELSYETNEKLYVLDKVSLTRDGEKKDKLEIEVELENGSKEKVSVQIDNNTVTVTVPNPLVDGYYALNVKKVNLANENKYLSGVGFKADNLETVETDNSGTATLIGATQIKESDISNGTITHVIKEVSVPNENVYRKLECYDIKVDLSVENVGSKYVVTGVSATPVKKDGVDLSDATVKAKADKELEMITDKETGEVPVELNNNVVTVKVRNELVYNVDIKKAEYENETNFLQTAKFKVTGEGEKVVASGTYQEITEAMKNIAVEPSKTYTYFIEETEAPDGYVNVFKDKNALITLSISVGENGIIDSARYFFTFTDEASNEDKAEKAEALAKYVKNVEVNKQTNTVSVFITNPQVGKYYEMFVNKVDEKGNYLSGATFKVSGKDSSGVSLGSDITSPVTTDGTNKAKQIVKHTITRQNVKLVDTYTITEDKAPAGYYQLDEPIMVEVNKEIVDNILSVKSIKVNGKDTAIQGAQNNKVIVNGIKLKGTDKVAKATVSLNDYTINVVVENVEIVSSYNFTITKKDATTNKVIDDETTTFDVNVYTGISGATLTGKLDSLNDVSGNKINTTGIKAKTNGVAKIENIAITKAEIANKTYFFEVTETQAPDRYTEINYQVIVPISFEYEDGKYVAKHNTSSAIAIIKQEDGSKKVQPLESLANKDNRVLSTEQVDVTINVNVPNKPKEFDLSLRKFITKVNDNELKGDESREPKVDLTTLINGDPSKEGEKTATYTHTKEPVLVNPTDIVEYTLRVYNEGELDGYASRVIDDVPEGVTVVAPKYDENGKALNQNAEYRWIMYKKIDAKDVTIANDGADALEYKNKLIIVYKGEYYIETDKAEEAVIISTDYLSKENGEAMMAEDTKDKDDAENPNLLVKFDGKKLSYKDIKVQFKVNPTKESNIVITNYAQISENTYRDGSTITDRDSTVNEWIDGEDDQDIERITVRWFDLALYKWVSSKIITVDGVTKEYATGHSQDNKKEIVNVLIEKDKLNKTVVKFKYQIKVENQGTIEGYAKEIKDHIPQGLKFVAEDNKEFRWKQQSDGTITTDYLKDTLLQPKQTAEVTVVLTWINGSNNLGEKVNFAEISEDYNKYNAEDIDSKTNNFTGKSIEDDEDDDKVMLQIKTGGGTTIGYVLIGIMFVTVVAGGVVGIKKYVM